jgi:hypothetical protein
MHNANTALDFGYGTIYKDCLTVSLYKELRRNLQRGNTMTIDQFQIAIYEISAAVLNALTTLVQDLGPYAGPALEGISYLLLAADIALHYIAEGLCFVSGD